MNSFFFVQSQEACHQAGARFRAKQDYRKKNPLILTAGTPHEKARECGLFSFQSI